MDNLNELKSSLSLILSDAKSLTKSICEIIDKIEELERPWKIVINDFYNVDVTYKGQPIEIIQELEFTDEFIGFITIGVMYMAGSVFRIKDVIISKSDVLETTLAAHVDYKEYPVFDNEGCSIKIPSQRCTVIKRSGVLW